MFHTNIPVSVLGYRIAEDAHRWVAREDTFVLNWVSIIIYYLYYLGSLVTGEGPHCVRNRTERHSLPQRAYNVSRLFRKAAVLY